MDAMENLRAYQGVFKCENSRSKTGGLFCKRQKYSAAGEVLVPKRKEWDLPVTTIWSKHLLHSTNDIFSASPSFQG